MWTEPTADRRRPTAAGRGRQTTDDGPLPERSDCGPSFLAGVRARGRVLAAVGGRWSAVVLFLLAAALRFRSLFANTFHADEALFATWARLIAVWRDPLLAAQPVDKPPLLFYSQALFYPFFGPVEWAARLPALIASLLLVPLTAQFAWRLSGDRLTAATAALVIAVAPLAIQFSATAFSDPLLTFWLMSVLVLLPAAGHRSRPALAGFCFGLALATKYQAALFLPLVLGLGWLGGWGRREWTRALLGLAAVLALLAAWGVSRSGGTPVVAAQWANVGGVRLAWSWELWPRLLAQGRLWLVGLGWPLAVLGAAAMGGVAISRDGRARLSPRETLVSLFVLAYLLIHWLGSIPAWDRYLLPVLPLVAALIGRGVSLLWSGVCRRGRILRAAAGLGLVIIGVLGFVVAANARAGRYPIGGRPDADGGAAVVARALADAPYGTVLYDHWYSWHWRYQLFDRRVYVSWFPDADALVEDLAAFGGAGPARYIALPASGTAAPVVRRLQEAGYRLELVSRPRDGVVALWRISSETTGSAD